MFKNKRLIFITSCLLLIINYPNFAGDILSKNIYLNEVNKFTNSENLTYKEIKRLIDEINRFDVSKKNYRTYMFKEYHRNASKILYTNIKLRNKYIAKFLHIQNNKKNENNLRDLR